MSRLGSWSSSSGCVVMECDWYIEYHSYSNAIKAAVDFRLQHPRDRGGWGRLPQTLLKRKEDAAVLLNKIKRSRKQTQNSSTTTSNPQQTQTQRHTRNHAGHQVLQKPHAQLRQIYTASRLRQLHWLINHTPFDQIMGCLRTQRVATNQHRRTLQYPSQSARQQRQTFAVCRAQFTDGLSVRNFLSALEQQDSPGVQLGHNKPVKKEA